MQNGEVVLQFPIVQKKYPATAGYFAHSLPVVSFGRSTKAWNVIIISYKIAFVNRYEKYSRINRIYLQAEERSKKPVRKSAQVFCFL